jgi:hypothetical protein
MYNTWSFHIVKDDKYTCMIYYNIDYCIIHSYFTTYDIAATDYGDTVCYTVYTSSENKNS